VTSRNIKWLVVLMSLVTAATVSAAPTIDNSDPKLTVRIVSPAPDLVVSLSNPTDIPSNNKVILYDGFLDSALARIAADILKPPADFTNSSALPPGTRPLPAVPAALFMGLTGFLCVTLVRDRKVWLAGITFLLWAGQVGITALPQKCRVCIAHHLNKRWAVPTLPSLGEQFSRLRCELEGTEYIGLLRYLQGIPTTPQNSNRITTNYKQRITNYEQRTPNIAVINTVYSYLLQAFICLSYEVRQFTCFSPAFIFNSIPRGPPISL